MIVAGLGFRTGCGAEDILQAVHKAQDRAGCIATSLAAPSWKRHEPSLHEAASRLGLFVVLVDTAALAAVQPQCPTRSALAERVTGIASVAEGAALAASGGRLLLARVTAGRATCALSGP